MCWKYGKYQAFFGRFSAAVKNSSWRNLEFKKKLLSFSKNSLAFSENSLSLFKRMGFFTNSLNFFNFKLRLVEKLRFGQFFVKNILILGLF